jgi:hypothetical protein
MSQPEQMISATIVELILRNDVQATRFERFCNDAVSNYEGDILVLPTSASWDLGRDGRRESSQTNIYVCSSLSDDVDAKSEADIRRLIQHAALPFTVYFCSSQSLSEHRCNEVAAELRRIVPQQTIVVPMGSIQLGAIAERAPAVFLKFYGPELANYLAVIRSSIDRPLESDDSLRVALLGVLHDNSDEVRRSIYEDAIRTALSAKPCTAEVCAQDVSRRFRLGHSLGASTIAPHLEHLERNGEVWIKDGFYELSEVGRAALQKADALAREKLLSGREDIRDVLESELGYRLAEDQYERIWSIVRDTLSTAFFERGQQIVARVGELLSGTQNSEGPTSGDNPLFFLEGLADAVALTSSHSDQQEELRTAIRDLFVETTGPAFDFLSRLCASYVALCTLGIEYQSGRAIAGILSKLTLVLDSDIAISLLCEGEANHDSVSELVTKWRSIGRGVMVGREVIQEVARHAAIAHNDFEEVVEFLPGTEADRQRLINNAFVRAFAKLLAEKRIRRNEWGPYIGEYTANGKEDIARISDVFRSMAIETLPPATAAEKELETKTRTLLEIEAAKRFSGQRLAIERDKASRDASLYASLYRFIRSARDADMEQSAVLVSSARRIALVEQRMRAVGDPQLVIALGAILHVLSLVPGVSVGIGAMRSLLFDLHQRFSSDLERLLLRTVSRSREATIPWAKRHTLMRRVRTKLLDAPPPKANEAARDAELWPSSESEIRFTAGALSEALEAVVVPRKSEQEIAKLQRTVNSQEDEIQFLQRVVRRRSNLHQGEDDDPQKTD